MDAFALMLFVKAVCLLFVYLSALPYYLVALPLRSGLLYSPLYTVVKCAAAKTATYYKDSLYLQVEVVKF